MYDMLVRCWQSNPKDRLTIGEILNILIINSNLVRDCEIFLSSWGENHRWKYEFEDVSL